MSQKNKKKKFVYNPAIQHMDGTSKISRKSTKMQIEDDQQIHSNIKILNEDKLERKALAAKTQISREVINPYINGKEKSKVTGKMEFMSAMKDIEYNEGFSVGKNILNRL